MSDQRTTGRQPSDQHWCAAHNEYDCEICTAGGGWVTDEMIDEVNAMGKPNGPATPDVPNGEGEVCPENSAGNGHIYDEGGCCYECGRMKPGRASASVPASVPWAKLWLELHVGKSSPAAEAAFDLLVTTLSEENKKLRDQLDDVGKERDIANEREDERRVSASDPAPAEGSVDEMVWMDLSALADPRPASDPRALNPTLCTDCKGAYTKDPSGECRECRASEYPTFGGPKKPGRRTASPETDAVVLRDELSRIRGAVGALPDEGTYEAVKRNQVEIAITDREHASPDLPSQPAFVGGHCGKVRGDHDGCFSADECTCTCDACTAAWKVQNGQRDEDKGKELALADLRAARAEILRLQTEHLPPETTEAAYQHGFADGLAQGKNVQAATIRMLTRERDVARGALQDAASERATGASPTTFYSHEDIDKIRRECFEQGRATGSAKPHDHQLSEAFRAGFMACLRGHEGPDGALRAWWKDHEQQEPECMTETSSSSSSISLEESSSGSSSPNGLSVDDAERLRTIIDEEWGMQVFDSNEAMLDFLERSLFAYRTERQKLAIAGITPAERTNATGESLPCASPTIDEHEQGSSVAPLPMPATDSSLLEGGPGFARGYSRGWTDAMRFIQEHGPATANDSGRPGQP